MSGIEYISPSINFHYNFPTDLFLCEKYFTIQIGLDRVSIVL